MVINFICRASKADKSGQSPLEVSIIINGNRRILFLRQQAGDKLRFRGSGGQQATRPPAITVTLL